MQPPLTTLPSGELVVHARFNAAQRALLKEGRPVEVVSEDLGLTVAGTVDGIGELAEDEGGGRSHPMTVRPTGGPFDERLAMKAYTEGRHCGPPSVLSPIALRSPTAATGSSRRSPR